MTASLIAGDRDGKGARVSRIVYRPTESLKINPKRPEKTHEKQIARGMTAFGNMVPILVGPDLHVCGARPPVGDRRCPPRQQRTRGHRPWFVSRQRHDSDRRRARPPVLLCRVEIDPVDTAIPRWQAYTGEPAYHALTGRSFDDISSTLGDGA
jgi:hypothetical protein